MISIETFLNGAEVSYEERFEFYQNFVRQLAKSLDTLSQNFLHGAVGCATEAGELLDVAKKIWIYNQTLDTVNKEGKTHRENIVEELGDTLFYMQHVLNTLNICWEEVIDYNVKKLSTRYKDGYSDAAAAARADKS